jgi:CCR4-NOT transcriptional regulation complex NOT5 subunit
MGLPKGKTNNPYGRPKGTPNRTTTEIKELMNQFISHNLDDLQRQYDQLEAKEKLMFFERVLKYVIPQQKDVTQNVDVSNLTEEELDHLLERILEKDE